MRFGITAVWSILLVACGGFMPWPVFPPTLLSSIEITSSPGSNNGLVALVDIVYGFDEEVVESTLPQTAREWFAQKSVLRFSLQNSIYIDNYQIPPGVMRIAVEFPERHQRAERVMLFVNYQPNEQYFEMELTRLREVRIELNERDVEVMSL